MDSHCRNNCHYGADYRGIALPGSSPTLPDAPILGRPCRNGWIIRDRDRNANSQRYARAEDATKPEAAGTTGNDEPPRKVRKRYKQPKIVRQFLRSMRGVMAGLPF